MRKLALLLAPIAGALATTAFAPAAHAAASEYVIILLDETGSMCTDSVPCAPTTGSFWLNALDDAKLWVNQDLSSLSATPQRFYSIWTFKNTQDGTQTNAAKLWPTSTFNTGCNTSHASIDATSGFCAFKSNDTVPYTALQNVLESIKTQSDQIPQPTWLTPLADGLCRALSQVWAANSNQNRTVILESDGGENDSALACLGPLSTTGNSTIDPTKSDWGFTVGSWNANVFRRAARLNSFDTPVGGDFGPPETSAVTAGPLTSSDSLPPQLTMKVSIQYALCAPGQTDPACVFPPTATPMMATAKAQALVASPTTFGPAFDGDATVQAKALTLASPLVASPLATTSTTTTQSIDANELAFFRALGKATKTSKIREVTRVAGAVYGQTHKLAGDVDDSGCVDHADYAIITQSDVWLSRAVQPNQIGIRADLNRDGWVNEQDRAIVLANWGKGCINNPGPKPVVQ
ncbi:MAG TPA: dockerin type I domain-containing protein [Polyangia bacterium]|nr:dockerin type I domain-containing protein [Polyangia bacterium]